jgi:A/G-specific adenine glycosylase
MTPGDFAPRLLDWFGQHGRHDLPWQVERNPYRVWLSEVMLQQTQVATVIPYFERFVARFPDLQALAEAAVDEVLHLWSGLGYYARARNLHRAARKLCAEHGGRFPDTVEGWLELPGVGRSTAAAILAQSADRRHAILDGNVKRVLARWFAIDGWPGEAGVLAALWQASEAVTPATRAADYTQAIMDLGATLCTRSRPRCGDCPVRDGCRALATGRIAELPARRPAKAARRHRTVTWLVAHGPEGVYLEQRPARGIWGGLWGFPEFPDAASAIGALNQRFAVTGAPVAWPAIDHAFTHFDLTIEPLIAGVGGSRAEVQESPAVWYNLVSPPLLGLPTPVAGLLRELGGTSISAAPRSPPP